MKILLFRGRGISSALIRWQTWSKYSHAAVLLRDGTLIESYPGTGVIRLGFTNRSRPDRADGGFDALIEQRGGCIALTPTISLEQESRVIEFLASQCSKPYDWRGVFRFVLPFIKRNPLDSLRMQNRWFCSDLIAAAFDWAGCALLYRIPFWKVSPEKLQYSTRLQADYNPDWDREDD